MEKELLYKFFEGKASMEEGLKIKVWVETSGENEAVFFQERKFFDALVLHTSFSEIASVPNPFFSFRKINTGWLKMTAAILLTLIFNYLYQEYKEAHLPIIMNTLAVPAGQRVCLTLPDSTNVWLNACTTLKYPTSFNGQKRMVILQGEAFFEVTKNKDKPFVVHTEAYDIEVVGTAFNVEAYPEQQKFETTLMRGSVKVISQANPLQSATLEPEHKVSLENGQFRISEVKDYNPYRWKEGIICFKDDSFSNIMKQFEKYFGIKMVINNENLLKYNFTGKFRQSEGLDYALRILQKNIDFKYEKDIENQMINIY